MYIYLKVQLIDYVLKSFKTYLAFKPCRKKMRRNILLIKIKDYMVLIHVLRKLQVKIFLNSANIHFQKKKGKT